MGSSPSKDTTQGKQSNSTSKTRQSTTAEGHTSSSNPEGTGSHTPNRRNQTFKEVEMSSSRKPEPDQESLASNDSYSSQEPGEEDIVFETFYHKDGQTYQCCYQNGTRYYLDNWVTKEWQVFPMEWYKQGILVTDTVVSATGQETSYAGGGEASGAPGQSGAAAGQKDDREGILPHPTHGNLQTYMFEESRNVHCFFHEETGTWVKTPISWELRTEFAKELVAYITDCIKEWTDKADILASLRANNYNADATVSNYFLLQNKGGDLPISGAGSKGGGKKGGATNVEKMESELENLRSQSSQFEKEVEKLRKKLTEKEKEVDDLNEKFAGVQASLQMEKAKNESMQRPKTAARPKTPVVQKGLNAEATAVVKDASKNLQSLRKSYVQLRESFTSFKGGMADMLLQLKAKIKDINKFEGDSKKEMEEVRGLYRKEVEIRKQLYNKLCELRGNIRVFMRPRKENIKSCLTFHNDQEVSVVQEGGRKNTFSFDKCYKPEVTQEQVFEDTCPIVTSCVDGYNVCILAYGQTGSGKTYTMMGPDNNPGVNIRALIELLRVCKEREKVNYSLKVSMVEIYNETVQDLLTDDAKVLELRSAGNKVHIPGIKEMEATNLEDIKKVMALGDKNRHVASTKMNSESSRSHLVFMVKVEGVDKVSGAVSTATLYLCDLAGSERVGKTEAKGQRLVEAAAINKSLTSLGQVFTSLRQNQLHVPYRNSKLTLLLQNCLGGDAKCALFVNCRVDEVNAQETISTLLFGSNARQVELGQVKKNVKPAK